MDPRILRELGEWVALGFYEARSEPWPMPYARALRRLYENMDIHVPADRLLIPFEPLPAARTFTEHGVWHATSLILDSNHNSGLRINRDMAELKKADFPRHAAFIDALVADLSPRLSHFGGYTHSNPDIRRVVSEGFDAMEDELDREWAAIEANPAAEPDERHLLRALKDYAVGVRAFHHRTLETLEQARLAARGSRRADLDRIVPAFAGSFLKPADSFLGGLLAVNFTWMLDFCDSIGRLDQALGPLFARDVDEGRLDLAFARRLLDETWGAFERLNGWNLQIGGWTPDGHDGTNRLTLECLAACERNRHRRPNVAFRITRRTPDAAVIAALKVLREGSGRPALYNDEGYVSALLDLPLGLNESDAREIGFGGCTETMVAGLSNVGSLEGSLNLAKAIELAIHDGFDPIGGRQEGPHTGRFDQFHTFHDFTEAVKTQIREMTERFVTRNREDLARRFRAGDPKLARTFFTRDCVKRHKSFEAGGARYNWAVVSYYGIANLIDSLAAIRRCVFEEHSITASDLRIALADDFVGHEPMRRRLLAVPKFGNDDPAVDDPGAAMVRFAWDTLLGHETPRGGRYLPSCILFATYADAGAGVGATPDGRKAKGPLVDSVGATAGRDRRGPTALLNSVTKLPLHLAVGTPVLNIRLQRQVMESESDLRKLLALVRAYFAKGGLQIQISVLNREELLAARREPEKHGDLIVRIGGYSEYFTRLSPTLQDTVIARTEHGV
jgi:formate C-acetyltransferase